MRLTAQNREAIKRYYIDAIEPDDKAIATDEQKLQHARDRFLSEYGWQIEQVGELNALEEWLSGLALNIDYTYSDILKRAEEWGQPTETEKERDKILEHWFRFSGMQYLKLWRTHKIK